MRAFIAIELPERFKYETADLSRALARAIDGRFAPIENFHVTLAFLGDIDQRETGLAIDALEAAHAQCGPIALACDGLGTFGKASDATLWLGLKPADSLLKAAELAREELTSRAVPFDPKPFKPHVTLARRANVSRGNFPSLPFPNPAEARFITLFKSELSPDGATYRPLHTIQLG